MHQVSPLLCIGLSFFNGKASRNCHRFQMIRSCRFLRSSKIFGYFVALICHSSVDTELIRRNRRAEKQLDVFIATVEVYRILAMFFASQFSSLKDTKYWMSGS